MPRPPSPVPAARGARRRALRVYEAEGVRDENIIDALKSLARAHLARAKQSNDDSHLEAAVTALRCACVRLGVGAICKRAADSAAG